MGKIREIERLRGLAILMVLFCHWGDDLPRFLHRTWSGVDLFFVISGFVISRSFLASLPNLESIPSIGERLQASALQIRVFFTKRFYRILPLAVFVVVASWGFELLRNDYDPEGTHRLFMLGKETVGLLAGFYNYTFKTVHSGYFTIYWSLYVEEHFYLLFPFLMIVFPSKSRRIGLCLAVIAVVSLVLRPLTAAWNGDTIMKWYQLRTPTHLRFDALMVGVLINLIGLKWNESFQDRSNWLKYGLVPLAIFVLCFVPLLLDDTNATTPYIALWGISALLVQIASWEKGLVFQIPFAASALEYFGSRSYALYLSHPTIHRIFDHALKPYGIKFEGPLYWGALLVMTIGLADIMHRTIEKPMISYGVKRVKKLKDDALTQREEVEVTQSNRQAS